MKNSVVRSLIEHSLKEAKKAFSEGNYPIGCVLVNEKDEILSIHRNQSITSNDISAHAEIECIRNVYNNTIDNRSSNKLTLITSLEPCAGCSFFIERTAITHVIWALSDPHKGGLSRLKSNDEFAPFFKKITITTQPYDDLAIKSKNLMRTFFENKNRKDLALFYS